MKYEVGDVVLGEGVYGVVVPNVKLPGDICVRWTTEILQIFSYDEEWLDENVKIVENIDGKKTLETC